MFKSHTIDLGLDLTLNKYNNAEIFFKRVELISFLDASSHLYNWVCPSVGPSVRRSVGPSVGDAFVKNGKIDDFDRK